MSCSSGSSKRAELLWELIYNKLVTELRRADPSALPPEETEVLKLVLKLRGDIQKIRWHICSAESMTISIS